MVMKVIRGGGGEMINVSVVVGRAGRQKQHVWKI
jgi:hypothetical protein